MINGAVFLDRGSLKAKVRRPSCVTDYADYEKTAPSEIVKRLSGARVAADQLIDNIELWAAGTPQHLVT
jgi:hypothetical protein